VDGTGDSLDRSMILLQDLIEIFHLADDDRRPVLGIVAPKSRPIGLTAIHGDRFRHAMLADRLGEESCDGLLVALFRQRKIDRLPGLIAA
jgi:hypothetical protein